MSTGLYVARQDDSGQRDVAQGQLVLVLAWSELEGVFVADTEAKGDVPHGLHLSRYRGNLHMPEEDDKHT